MIFVIEEGTMYREFANWIDKVLAIDLPEETVAIGFNLYEETDKHWSIQLVATDRFDMEDEDWVCDEVFTTGENLYSWQEKTNWESILEKAKMVLIRYLEEGMYAEKIKQFEGIGIGFVDGNIEIVFTK